MLLSGQVVMGQPTTLKQLFSINDYSRIALDNYFLTIGLKKDAYSTDAAYLEYQYKRPGQETGTGLLRHITWDLSVTLAYNSHKHGQYFEGQFSGITEPVIDTMTVSVKVSGLSRTYLNKYLMELKTLGASEAKTNEYGYDSTGNYKIPSYPGVLPALHDQGTTKKHYTLLYNGTKYCVLISYNSYAAAQGGEHQPFHMYYSVVTPVRIEPKPKKQPFSID